MSKRILDIMNLAESRLLGAILKNKNIIYEKNISEDMFSSDNKPYFNAIKDLHEKGVQITKEAYVESVTKYTDKFSLVLIDNHLNSQYKEGDNISDIIDDVKKCHTYTKLSMRLSDAAEVYNRIDAFDEKEINELREALDKVEDALSSTNQQEFKLKTAEEWGNSYNQEFERRKDGKIYKFFDKVLDNMIVEGPTPGGGGLITASTGMGKSAYCLNMINNFINNDIPCLYFTMEMSEINTYDRLMAIRTKIPFKNFINIQNTEDFESLKQTIKEEQEKLKKNKNFRVCENPSMSLKDLENYIKKFQQEIGQKYCIVIIDLITMIKEFSSVDKGSLANSIEIAINKLNAMSKTLGFHYIGVAQLNRTVEQDKVIDIKDIQKLRPTRAAIKNSGALLERPRYSISLFRPYYYAETYLNPEDYDDMDDIIEVGLIKANNNKTGKQYMAFDGETFSCSYIENYEQV